MLKSYFKIAVRNLIRNKVNTLINILGIALGISVAVVIYVILNNEASFDSFHSRASNTYRIVQHNHTADGTQYWNTTAYPLAGALRQDLPGLTVAQAAGPLPTVLAAENTANIRRFEEDKVLFADEHYLSVFDFDGAFPGNNFWLAGSSATAFAHPNAVVLTQSAAERYFPDELSKQKGVVGKTLIINDQDVLVVTGVIRDPPPNTSLSFDVLVAFEYFKTKNQFQVTNWSGNYQGTTFVVLPEQTEAADFQKALTSVKSKYMSPEDNKRVEYVLQPLSEVHTDTLYGSSPGSYVVGREVLIGLMSLGLFIVLIACVNYIILATAQSLKRTREVGVRKVLGATSKQLFVQYMSEAFIITLLATVLSVFVADIAIDYLNRELSFIRYQFIVDQDLLLFGAVIWLIIMLISGSYPSFVLSKQPPAHVLKNRATPSKSGFSVRRGLIVFQFSIAQLLIAATIIVAGQMHFFRNKELGYRKESVLTVSVPGSEAGKKEAFRQRLLQRTEIANISFSSGAPTPYNRQYGTSFRLPSEPVEMMREAEMKMVDPEYAAVYKLNIVTGSWVTEANKTEGFNGLVVNEALARMLGEEPEALIGKKLTINEGEAPVVGVVRDFHNNGLQDAISPCVFLYWGPDFLDEASIQLADGPERSPDLEAALNVIETAWKATYPEEVFSFNFLNESLEQHYRLENLVYKAFRIASAIAIFIACLGLYGLVSFVVVQRTKEVGIRKLLGASVPSILQLLSRDFMKLVTVAVLIATPVAWYVMHHWLQGFTYRISLHWWYFLGAASLTMGIALCTVGYQVLKAARANPVKNLRTE